MSFDPYGQPVFTRRSPAPIVLLVLVLLASGGANYWLWKERQRATSEVHAAVGKLTAAEAVHKELTEKVAKLETENAELAEAKLQLTKDVEAKGGELARLKDDIAGVENGKPASADDKSDGDAGKGDKADKKADKKAEADKKADKAEARKKKKAAASARKKDSARSEKPPGDREL